MKKIRVNAHVRPETFRKLDQVTARPGVSKAAIVDAALSAFLSPENDDQRDAAIIRRLDRISRQFDKLDRDQTVISETLALFVRYYLTITTPVPDTDQDAARALGKERFDYFVAQLAKRLAAGKSLVRDVLEEFEPSEADFFTSADLSDANGSDGEAVSHD